MINEALTGCRRMSSGAADRAWLKHLVMALATTALVAGCGGGGGEEDKKDDPGPQPVACSTVYTDSYNRPVTCAEMRALPGANFWESADASGAADGNDGGAGADGVGADGAPIANTTIRIIDVDGKTVDVITNAEGYFRVNIGGLKQPLVATVLREGNAWRSAMVDVIETGTARQKFYTLNVTGLTDLVLTQARVLAGKSDGSDAVTPVWLSNNLPRVSDAVTAVKQQFTTQLQQAGIDVANFDPLRTPFKADRTGYDQVLESVTINKENGITIVDPVDPVPEPSGLSGTWDLSLTTITAGYSYPLESIGPVDGVSVPRSASDLALIDELRKNSGLFETESYDEYTVTSTINDGKFVVTMTGPGTNYTTSIDKWDVNNYVGCGACEVGSTVSLDIQASVSFSGMVDGIQSATGSFDYTMKFQWRRVQ